MRTTLLWVGLMALIAGCGPGRAQAEPGPVAPDFELPTVAGTRVALDDFDDRPVLLYFHMAVG